ncbi:MAG: hypothetical protein IT423_18265 [Pirellulaceae bacterium]|nr:hypothetical protein [Pirellulaceae bacterium]
MSAIVTSLNQIGMQAFGLTMPRIAPGWAPNGVVANFTASDDDFTLTSDANWAAPLAVVSRRIDAGTDFGITLVRPDGTFEQGPGVLLTVFPQQYLRLCRLYANALEPAQPNRPERARGLPWRPVPRYFFFPGALTANDKNGNINPWDDLQRQGPMRIYDNDGLPIDVLAVANIFGVLMDQYPILQATILGAQFAANNIPLTLMVNQITANTAAVRVRMSVPSGQPYNGARVQGATAVNATNGVFAMPGVSLTLAPVDGTFPQAVRDRLWIGPATTGRLGAQFAPAALAGGITLTRDFFSVRVVDVSRYILGSPNSSDPGVQAEQQRPVPVRINEPLNLLADGNQVAAAAGAAIANGPLSICVAPTIAPDFNLPTVAAPNWPGFPGVPPVANVTVPLNLSNGFNPSASWFNDNVAATPDIDVIFTLNGLPPGAWVRVYPRKFLPDAIEGRGDGAGALVPASGTITLRLIDPLGLRRPQDVNPASVSIPAQATLRADVMVLLPNGNGRIFGNVSTPINGTVAVAPPTGANNLTAATFQGISLAGILGLRTPGGPIPASLAAFLQQLAAMDNPRDAPRLPTMARRELIAAGRSAGGNWSAVISGGRLTGEIISAQNRRGAPGGPGGRELQAVGVSTQNGRLAYDIALAGLRHAMGVVFTSTSVATDPNYSVPAEPTALAVGVAQTAAQGTFAGAVLGNIAPYCEVPDFNVNLTGLTITPDDIINFLQSNFTIPAEVNSILNALKTGSTGNAPQVVQNIGADLPIMLYGKRDTQWSLLNAIQNARRFIYIESPGFCSTAKDPGANPLPTYAVDLIAAIRARMTNAQGLHVIICTPKMPDFSPGYEPLAAYEVADRRRSILGDDTAVPPVPGLPGQRTVAFHPIGFPGRPARIETTTVIVDDCYALVGSSTFRRRGLTFDGSYDLAFCDAQVESGGSPAIAAFRRAILAQRLGVTAASTDPTFVRLRDGVESLYAIREFLLAGGLGRIDRLWNGETPGLPMVTPAPIDQANPEGREFDLPTALALALLATFNGL